MAMDKLGYLVSTWYSANDQNIYSVIFQTILDNTLGISRPLLIHVHLKFPYGVNVTTRLSLPNKIGELRRPIRSESVQVVMDSGWPWRQTRAERGADKKGEEKEKREIYDRVRSVWLRGYCRWW
jgi:hypothetical protein